MPGMGSRGLSNGNPVIVAAFHSALFHGLLAVVVVAMVAILIFLLLSGKVPHPLQGSWRGEPVGRRVLRLGFAVLWVVDGLLQVQPQMPIGLPTEVLQPSAATSPGWVQHVVAFGAGLWEHQPIKAAAAAVWIQLGLGLWLLLVARGPWSRLGGAASAAWALVVWSVGNGFGGIFAPGLSLLFGGPGSSLLYVAAGIVLALPEGVFSSRRFVGGQARALGAFLVVMGILQAWPGRGTWMGNDAHGQPVGAIPAMSSAMAQTPQPHLLATAVANFARAAGSAPVLFNGAAVLAMVGVGLGYLSLRPKAVRLAMVVGLTLAALVWIFIEDLGLFGGLSTDPNTMPALALWLVAAAFALRYRAPVPEAPPRQSRLAAMVAAVGAACVVAVGVLPATVATAAGGTDPILATAQNGGPQAVNFAALPFSLVDGAGHPVTMASLRGKVVAMTFLDPVCTTDCPLIAQEFKASAAALGAEQSKVAFVAVAANPIYYQQQAVAAFDAQEHLTTLPDWHFVTGSLAELRRLWLFYGVEVTAPSAGSMAVHNDVTYLFDPSGRARVVLNTDPGSSAVLRSSFSALLDAQIGQLLR